MNESIKKKETKKTKKKINLKVPNNEFNPRIVKVNPDDEKFFAYESQRSHSH